MIYKSYLVEENFDLLKNNLALFYGENRGLISEFKKKITTENKGSIIKLSQNEILSNENLLFNEMNNISLFDEIKIFFIDEVNDKILKIFNEIISSLNNNKVYLFSSVLDKKSKLRSICEKENFIDVIPCYADNEMAIKKLIVKYLKNYSGVTPEVINILTNVCSNDRIKLKNETNKIKDYFLNKTIKQNDLLNLVNVKEDNDFSLLRDTALNGNAINTNVLLNSLHLEIDKISLYLTIINQRLLKLNEIVGKKNIEKAITELKPVVFWKDKPNFIIQAKIWNRKKINHALKKSYEVEHKIKSFSTIDKTLVLKKLIVDMCVIATSA